MGKVAGIYIATSKRDRIERIDCASLEAGKGIVGDRYHSNAMSLIEAGKSVPRNHVTLIAKEELDVFLDKHKSELDYGDFRRNIVTSGVDLNALVDKDFTVGTAVFHGFELCEPCATLAGMVHSSVLSELVHKAGLRAVIIKDGEVSVGDEILQ
jgi:MOSC domain-containing protein YiiM